MNFFKRLFKIGQAEANAAIGNIEDPIKLTEQGIADLQAEINKSIEALAQVKAQYIRSNNDAQNLTDDATSFEEKALAILRKAQNGDLGIDKADELAQAALVKAESAKKQAQLVKAEAQKLEGNVQDIEQGIQKMKQSLLQWKNELKSLKARVKVNDAKQQINKQMANLGNSDTIAMLERMKEKVAQESALAEAFGEIASNAETIEDAIDSASDMTTTNAKAALDAMKKQLGIDNQNS